jgi:uncharacterized protein YndB with AHSA1/START domain
VSCVLDPGRDLVLERTLEIPPASVWAAWTTPDLLMRWFPPVLCHLVGCEVDRQPGGRFNTTLRSPDGADFPSHGSFVLIDVERTLIFTSLMTEGFRPSAPTRGADDLPFTGRIEPTLSGTGTAYRAVAIHSTSEVAARDAAMGVSRRLERCARPLGGSPAAVTALAALGWSGASGYSRSGPMRHVPERCWRRGRMSVCLRTKNCSPRRDCR